MVVVRHVGVFVIVAGGGVEVFSRKIIFVGVGRLSVSGDGG